MGTTNLPGGSGKNARKTYKVLFARRGGNLVLAHGGKEGFERKEAELRTRVPIEGGTQHVASLLDARLEGNKKGGRRRGSLLNRSLG